MTKLSLTSPIYSNEDKAREHLESILWPTGPVCPRCGVTEDRITKLSGKSTRPGVYKCKDCRKPFSVTVGTVMERSHIPLTKWVLAAQLMSSSKKGMSAHQVHRMLGTTYETAWFLFHRLREATVSLNSGPLGGANKVVELTKAISVARPRTRRSGHHRKKLLCSRLSSAMAKRARSMSPMSLLRRCARSWSNTPAANPG